MHDIAILDEVPLALQAEFPFRASCCHAAKIAQFSVRNHLSPDKTFLQIAVDYASGFGSRGPLLNGPGSHFVFAHGEKRLQPHQIILRPVVTEKGMHRSSRYNQYAFEVNTLATKDDIRRAVEELAHE